MAERVKGEGTCIKSALIHGARNLICVQAQSLCFKEGEQHSIAGGH